MKKSRSFLPIFPTAVIILLFLGSCDGFFWQEEEDSYRIRYDGNGAESGYAPVDLNKYEKNETATILDNSGILSKTDYGFFRWNSAADGSGTMYSPGDTVTMDRDMKLYAQWRALRRFKALGIDSTGSTYSYSLDALLFGQGEHCLVYVEDGSDVSKDIAQAVANDFDNDIFGPIITNFGEPYDVDHNGKLILLLLDIQDGYDGTGGYYAGYFDPVSMFSSFFYPNSNQADMLFLDTFPSEVGSQAFYETIAHEFQHLINFSQNYILDEGDEQDLWINEGLSAGAEFVYSGRVNQDRVDWYNIDHYDSIKQGNNFFVWNGTWEQANNNTVLDNYATVYLFFQWLRLHASNGTGIFREILDSNERDYLAVTEAAADRIGSQFNTWETLLGTWHKSNAFNEAVGLNGYKDVIPDVAMPLWNKTGTTEHNFYPGEGVFFDPAESYSPPDDGNYIRYLELIDDELALVFNANEDNGGDPESATIASIAPDSVLTGARSVADKPAMPTSWKLDLHLNPDRSRSAE